MVRSQILKARKYRRSDLLNKEKREVNQNNKLFLNITYHPSLSHLKHTLNDIHILLTPDKEHKKVFENVPTLPKGECTSCAGKRCQICNVVKTTDNFQVITKDKKYFIRKVNLNCNTSHVIYLIECKTCGKPYIGSTETPFRARFNNYRSAQRNFEKGKKVKQESFHVHFSEEGHYGEKDWVITLIDSAKNVEELR